MSKLHLIIGNRNYSSWSMRPWLAMTAVGIPFRETVIPLFQDNHKTKISRYSKSGRVPVLHDGKTVIWDSLAIMEYLAETFPSKGLWPKAKAARALARSISYEMHSSFMALRTACPMNLHRPRKAMPINDEVKADVARIEQIWKECRKSYGKDGKFLFGKFTIADAMFTPVAVRFETYAIPVSKESRAYMDAVLNHKAFLAWKKAALAEKWTIEKYEAA